MPVASHSGGLLPLLLPRQYGEGWWGVLQLLRSAARKLPEVPGDNSRTETPRGLGSLTRGLNPNANEGSSPSSPLLVPQVSTEEVDGSAFRDLPGLMWNQDSGTAQIGSFPVGGRLSLFLSAWQKLTSDRWVLEVVSQGYSLPFRVEPPPLSRIPYETPLPRLPDKRQLLWDGISSLLHKGAVEVVHRPEASPGYYSHYFLAPKKTGDLRPILNLRGLNKFLRVDTFRMETLTSILLGIHQGWWMVSLDLKDAYLYVPIHRSHWRYMRFALRNSAGILVVYQWTCLPFGLATAPRVFTKVMLPLVAHLHQQGRVMYPYLDDIFHAQASHLQVCLTRDVAYDCTSNSGLSST